MKINKMLFKNGGVPEKTNDKEFAKELPKIPKNANIEYKKNRPLAYQIYDYLKKYAVGYENRIKSNELMKVFNINTNETLRTYIQEIRESTTLQKIVCSETSINGGYWIATNDEEVCQTLDHLYKRAMQMLKTYSTIKNKAQLNNQLRLKLNKYEKEIYESIIEIKK